VKDTEEARQLDLGADLLAALTHRRGRRVLVMVDETAGQAPQPVARLDRSTSDDDSLFTLDDRGSDHFRVAPQHEVVVGTGLELAAIDDPYGKRRPAIDAEMRRGHEGRA